MPSKNTRKHRYRPSSLVNPLSVLTAAAMGGIGGLYADKTLNSWSEDYKSMPGWKHGAIVGAAALLGAGVGLGLEGLRGSDYDYRSYTPEKKIPRGEQAVIAFSGGNGGDWHDNNLDREALDRQFGKNKYALFAYKDMPFAEEYMKRLPQNARLRIIGHSLGGPVAYEFAQKALEQGRVVEELDTLDPVGSNLGYSMASGKPENVRKWNNYYVAERHPDVIKGSDSVALAGGAMDAVPGANNVAVTGDHVDHKTIRYAMEGRNGKQVKPPKRLVEMIYGK